VEACTGENNVRGNQTAEIDMDLPHTLRRNFSPSEKQALSWNTQGQCRRGRLIKGSGKTIEEEVETLGTA
jgi:hypothetical protein